MKTISFEQLPQAVGQILEKIELLQETISHQHGEPETDRWFTIEELLEYDPEKRAKQTFYGLVSAKKIPFHKNGKRLTFLKSEIDKWLMSSQKVCVRDLQNTD